MDTSLADYWKQQKIYMVMRLDEPTTEMSEEMKVMTLMYRQLIYNHPNLDLTDVIADGMKAKAAEWRPPAAAKTESKNDRRRRSCSPFRRRLSIQRPT